jgi:tetratricopeptide (TPR) repeat protein
MPDDAGAHLGLATALFRSEKYAEALDSLHTAVEFDSESFKAYSLTGIILSMQGEAAAALDAYYKAARIKPDGDLYCVIGNTFMDNHQYPEAIEAYRAAIEIEPKTIHVYCNLGNALSENGQIEEAIAAFRAGLAIEPDDAETHYNLGLTLLEDNRVTAAIKEYREAVRIKPNYAEAFSKLGFALGKKGELPEAVNAQRTAINLNPEIPEAHCWLGDTLLLLRKHSEAVQAYLAALRLRPGYQEAANNLAFALQDALRSATDAEERRNIQAVIDKIKGTSQPNDDYGNVTLRTPFDRPIDPISEASNPDVDEGSTTAHDQKEIMDDTSAESAVAARNYLTVAELRQAIETYKATKASLTARGTTDRATVEARTPSPQHLSEETPKLSPSQLQNVIADSTLGRRQRRYAKLLEAVVVPPGGFQSVEEARQAGNLITTLARLRERQGQLGLVPEPDDERVAKAERARAAFYRAGKHRTLEA